MFAFVDLLFFDSKAQRGSIDYAIHRLNACQAELAINSGEIMTGFMLEQWHWWTVTLLACTFAFYFSNSKPAWVAIASTVVGGILWFKPHFPVIYQLGIFFAVAALGTVLTTLLMSGRKRDAEEADDEAPQRVMRVERLIGYVITLETPIVNGNGQFEIQGVTLRIRGRDCEAGEKVRVVSIDGINRELLMVEPLDGVDDD